MSLASDQGMLHSEFSDGYPPSEYQLLFENMSNLVRSAKFDREIAKLTNESVMKQVFSEDQIKDKGLKEEIRREIIRYWARNKLNHAANETTEPFVAKKVKKEIKELLESKKEQLLSAHKVPDFTVVNYDSEKPTNMTSMAEIMEMESTTEEKFYKVF